MRTAEEETNQINMYKDLQLRGQGAQGIEEVQNNWHKEHYGNKLSKMRLENVGFQTLFQVPCEAIGELIYFQLY